MELIEQLLEIAKEKKIPEIEIQLSLSTFQTSALFQTLRTVTDTEALSGNEIKELQAKLQHFKTEEELLGLIESFDTLFSGEKESFLVTYQKTFNDLVVAFIEKIKKL